MQIYKAPTLRLKAAMFMMQTAGHINFWGGHGRVFATFKRRILANWTRIRLKNSCVHILL